jgi:hypothetical protein
VNQALSYGLPVVGSPSALEGMGLEHERDVMLAAAPEAFAQAVCAVYGDQQLWERLSVHGLASLEGRFTTDVAKQALLAALSPVQAK